MTTVPTTMARVFRKRPVLVRAMEFTGGAENATEIINWILAYGGTARYRSAQDSDQEHLATYEGIAIDTLEGTMNARPGWWIIRGVQGEFYKCKPDIFFATYEEISVGMLSRLAEGLSGRLRRKAARDA